MNVLRNPGHRSSNCCIVSNWNSPIIQEVSSALTGGELQAFQLCVGVSLQNH